METPSEAGDRLRFEMLISELSAHFVRIPHCQVDMEIESALKRLRDFFRGDRCGLLGFKAGRSGFFVTHASYARGLEPVPGDLDLSEMFPWAFQRLLVLGETVQLSSVEEAPPAAARDRLSWRAMGVHSTIAIPIFGRSSIRHAIVLESLHEKRSWPERYVPRLRLLGEVFVNALERREADQALRESETRLALAAESADAGLWTLDAPTGRIWTTPKTREMHGARAGAQLDLETFLELLHPEDRERVALAIQEAFREKKDLAVEYRVPRPDGSLNWVAVRGRPYFVPSGEPERLMGVSMDATQRKNSDAELAQLRLELSHISRVRTLGEMAATLAHELNQPLGAILSNAEAAEIFLRRDSPDLGELGTILADIRHDGQRAGEIINRMRQLARKRQFDARPLDLRRLVHAAAELVHSLALSRKVSLHVETAHDLPEVRGDAVQLQQVLLNLVLNAMEAMAEQPPGERQILIQATRHDSGSVQVTVADTGPGIPEPVLGRLFEPFFTTRKEGLGLGLPISRSIIEAHQGRIEAQNNPRRGARVFFRLPASDRSQ